MKHIKKNQRGISLMEVVLALAIMSSVSISIAGLVSQYMDSLRTAGIQEHTSNFAKASKAFIADNYTEINNGLDKKELYVITASDLKNANYLPNYFPAKNNYGQTICTLIARDRNATSQLQTLNPLVLTEGGEVIDDLTLGSIVASLGAGGGAVYTRAPTFIMGAMNGWSMLTATYNQPNFNSHDCNGNAGQVNLTPGHPVVSLWLESSGNPLSTVLHREAEPSHPEYNEMLTPIVLNSVQTIGSSCTTGAIARDSKANLLTCKAAVWTAVFSDTDSNAYVAGDLSVGKHLNLRGVETAGADCSPAGALASDKSGALLNCMTKYTNSTFPLVWTGNVVKPAYHDVFKERIIGSGASVVFTPNPSRHDMTVFIDFKTPPNCVTAFISPTSILGDTYRYPLITTAHPGNGFYGAVINVPVGFVYALYDNGKCLDQDQNPSAWMELY